MSRVAIIGGTGLSELVGLKNIKTEKVDTVYGETSGVIESGLLEGEEVVFLSRHGKPHTIPPHKINYRANLDALHKLNVKKIIAVNAVGGISNDMPPKHIVIPHQIIDYTYGREHTFYDNTSEVELQHVDFSDPYDGDLRFKLISAAKQYDIPFSNSGVYACTQGPRLESSAEVQRLLRDGCDIVGMTGMPEAALARELGIAYASLCIVVNAAAGLSQEPITMADIHRVLSEGIADVLTLLKLVISQLK